MESEEDAGCAQSVSTCILKSPVMTISDEMNNSSRDEVGFSKRSTLLLNK